MKRVILVDADSDRKDNQVRVAVYNKPEEEKAEYNPQLDMGILLEAVCKMIRICHEKGISSRDDSVKACIQYLGGEIFHINIVKDNKIKQQLIDPSFTGVVLDSEKDKEKK